MFPGLDGRSMVNLDGRVQVTHVSLLLRRKISSLHGFGDGRHIPIIAPRNAAPTATPVATTTHVRTPMTICLATQRGS